MTLLEPLKPYLWAFKLGGATLALAGAAYGGYAWEHSRWEADKAQKERAAVKQERKATAVALEVRDEGEAKQAAIRTVYKTIKEKVYVYVPPATDGWTLPLGAVRLHDYAALGSEPPASPGEPIGAPSGVELSALLGTVSDNYGVCSSYREEAQRWRTWYARELAASKRK